MYHYPFLFVARRDDFVGRLGTCGRLLIGLAAAIVMPEILLHRSWPAAMWAGHLATHVCVRHGIADWERCSAGADIHCADGFENRGRGCAVSSEPS